MNSHRNFLSLIVQDDMGAKRPWMNLPYWFVFVVAVMSEFLYTLFRVWNSKPVINRHSLQLVGKGQFFPVGRAKKHGLIDTSRVPLNEGIQRSMDWYVKYVTENKKKN